MAFVAKFPGRCAADCDQPIDAGDVVEYVDDQLVHEGCVPTPEVERAPRPICGECFTEIAMNGACACL